MKLPQRPLIQVSLSSDEFEDLAREIAIDRQVRMFPPEMANSVRECITNFWEDGESATDKKQREDYRRDAQVVINYLVHLQTSKRNKKSKKRRSVAPAVNKKLEEIRSTANSFKQAEQAQQLLNILAGA